MMLGIGPDGHIASLFPGFPQLDVDRPIAVGVTGSPKPPPERISLTFAALNRSRSVWFLVSGDGKASAVAQALGGADLHDIPAAGVTGREETLWFLDRDAASSLCGPGNRALVRFRSAPRFPQVGCRRASSVFIRPHRSRTEIGCRHRRYPAHRCRALAGADELIVTKTDLKGRHLRQRRVLRISADPGGGPARPAAQPHPAPGHAARRVQAAVGHPRRRPGDLRLRHEPRRRRRPLLGLRPRHPDLDAGTARWSATTPTGAARPGRASREVEPLYRHCCVEERATPGPRGARAGTAAGDRCRARHDLRPVRLGLTNGVAA